jgi:hypothetical protein
MDSNPLNAPALSVIAALSVSSSKDLLYYRDPVTKLFTYFIVMKSVYFQSLRIAFSASALSVIGTLSVFLLKIYCITETLSQNLLLYFLS